MKFNQFWCLTAAKSTEPKNRDFSSSSSSSSSSLFCLSGLFGACEVLQKVKMAWEENVGGKGKKGEGQNRRGRESRQFSASHSFSART